MKAYYILQMNFNHLPIPGRMNMEVLVMEEVGGIPVGDIYQCTFKTLMTRSWPGYILMLMLAIMQS